MSIRPPHRPADRAGLLECFPPRGPSPGPPPIRRFNLILHRTAGLSLVFVVRAIIDLTRFADAEAEHRMWLAHHDGRAVVFVTSFERAEFYAERFAARGLEVSVEPA